MKDDPKLRLIDWVPTYRSLRSDTGRTPVKGRDLMLSRVA
jgi:hypothetical protein